MLAFRQIIDDPDEFVPVPSALRHHRTEVIFLALDAKSERVRPQLTLASLAGCWEGDEMVRSPQGEYEARHEFD